MRSVRCLAELEGSRRLDGRVAIRMKSDLIGRRLRTISGCALSYSTNNDRRFDREALLQQVEMIKPTNMKVSIVTPSFNQSPIDQRGGGQVHHPL